MTPAPRDSHVRVPKDGDRIREWRLGTEVAPVPLAVQVGEKLLDRVPTRPSVDLTRREAAFR